MKGLLRGLATTGAALALATALGTGLTAVTATPAFALSTPCSDLAIANPTPAHSQPSEKSPTVHFYHPYDTVYGACTYWNNQGEGHWYMQVDYNNGWVYIWIQRLNLGSIHECDYNGLIDAIPSSYCPLQDT